MPIARIMDGSVAEQRDLSIEDVPEHKRHMWRPVVYVGSGDSVVSTIVGESEVVITRAQQPITQNHVVNERDRRLALGFNYDFGDARGVHRIGTRKSDLDGWSEVSTYAGALIDSGDVTTAIAIVTDTGPCLVTAPEWRAIELKAAEFRQPLWAKSFALMASNPIPASFADDSHWS